MILRNISIAGQSGVKYIHVEHGKVKAIADDAKTFDQLSHEPDIDLDNALAFPGLINSHDHLDFNLFPQLGNRVYKNYTEWAEDIHSNNKDEIDAVLKVPLSLRVQWGIYKNLLNGFTTVVNHGNKLVAGNDLITVFQNCRSLHSTRLEKRWKWKLNNPFNSSPVVMHIGEGTDKETKKEIDEVIRWNILRKRIVAVHGVAMNEKQAGHFKALVWCPASNYFLLDKTADIKQLKSKTTILFGSDSTLSASWNIWEHIRLARSQGHLSDEELLQALTTNAARIWGLNECGKLIEGKSADIIVAKKTNNFFGLNPEDLLMVLHRGNTRLFDETIAGRIKGFTKDSYSRIVINGTVKFVQGDLPGLMQQIMKYYPEMKFSFTY
jgi:cytosine/adenosine deaminase-related metal-dependent hydrolase